MDHEKQLRHRASAAAEHAPHVMAVTQAKPTMLARMMASRAVDGSAFRASQLRTAMPAQGPPKIRR
jgi:hypothetical protein